VKRAALIVLTFYCAVLVGQLVHAPGGQRSAARNTWKLEAPGHAGSGSAFPISCVLLQDGRWQTLFLTARHVVANQPETGWEANRNSHRRIGKGTVLSEHQSQDAALVLFWSKRPIPVVILSARMPEFGERVWAVGYPLGGNLVITEGIVSGKNSASAPAYFGNSGGSVVDSKGAAIGIVVSIRGRRTPVPHLMLFTSLVDIRPWLLSHGISL